MRHWIEEDNEAYFKKVLTNLHGERSIGWNEGHHEIALLRQHAVDVVRCIQELSVRGSAA